MKKEEILIGKTIKEAKELLRNFNYRVVSEDGKDYMITHDLIPNRYNLYIENGLIVDVKFF